MVPTIQTQLRARYRQGDEYRLPGEPLDDRPPAPAGGATPPPPPPPDAPQISSQYGANDPRSTEDKWFQFLNSQGYAKGPAGTGFYSGGGAYRGNLQGVVDAYNKATGSNARVGGSDDKINFGQGDQDVLQAGTNNWWLSPVGGSGGGAPGAGAGQGAGGGGAGAVPGATGSVSPFTQQIRDLLLQQLQGLSRPVTANDPSIKGEMDAQGALLERVRQERRAAAAERAAANGLLSGGQSSGAFEADVASGFEDKGQALSGLQAQLFGREIQSRRDKVAQLLSLAAQSGDAESARALQFQLAQMDDQLRRMGLSEQARQFDDTFGWNVSQGLYGRDRDLANAGLDR